MLSIWSQPKVCRLVWVKLVSYTNNFQLVNGINPFIVVNIIYPFFNDYKYSAADRYRNGSVKISYLIKEWTV